jgi:glycosyltransferase 2 family protein
MNRRQQLILALSLLISAVFLVLAFRGLNPGVVWGYIRNAQFGWLLAGFAISFAVRIVVTRRWKFLIDAIRPVPFGRLYDLVNIGYMGNNVYPFRAGEVLRCVLLQRSDRIPFAQSGVTVLIERAFDGIVMVTFVIIGLLTLRLDSELLRQGAAFTAFWFFVTTAIFFVLALKPHLFRRLIGALAGRLPAALGKRIVGLTEDVIGGLVSLLRPRDVLGAISTSYLTWMIEALAYLTVVLALNGVAVEADGGVQTVNIPVNYILMLVAVGAVNLGQIIPSSPGAVGVFEFFASTVLIAFGVPQAHALAYALLAHVIIWLPPTLHGLFALGKQGLSLSSVAHAREMQEQL